MKGTDNVKISTKVSLATLVAGGVYAGVKAYELVKTGKTTVFGFVTIINQDKYNSNDWFHSVELDSEPTPEVEVKAESVDTNSDDEKSDDIVIDFEEK